MNKFVPIQMGLKVIPHDLVCQSWKSRKPKSLLGANFQGCVMLFE